MGHMLEVIEGAVQILCCTVLSNVLTGIFLLGHQSQMSMEDGTNLWVAGEKK
jgi:hypothetical protein